MKSSFMFIRCMPDSVFRFKAGYIQAFGSYKQRIDNTEYTLHTHNIFEIVFKVTECEFQFLTNSWCTIHHTLASHACCCLNVRAESTA